MTSTKLQRFADALARVRPERRIYPKRIKPPHSEFQRLKRLHTEAGQAIDEYEKEFCNRIYSPIPDSAFAAADKLHVYANRMLREVYCDMVNAGAEERELT